MKAYKKRDFTIEKSFRRELSLATKTIKDKSKYSRKTKYKIDYRSNYGY